MARKNKPKDYRAINIILSSIVSLTKESFLSISILITVHFILNSKISALSFNQPKFCPTASWNPNPIIFANLSFFLEQPSSIFVNTNNTIYVANEEKDVISLWNENNTDAPMYISGNFTNVDSLFVTSNGDIYIGDASVNCLVKKYIAKNKTFVAVMYLESSTSDLFVDTNDTLYCSMNSDNQVVKRSLNDPDITSFSVAAGTGSRGSAFDELDSPSGIFVDVNFDLYVADCGNNRVQLFRPGELNGITVAGYGSVNPTINLNCPGKILLDAEKYLFILDSSSHRLIGSGLNGFRCLVGCYPGDFEPNRLRTMTSFSFDSFGNIFVADPRNSRIEKFIYLDTCSAASVNQPNFCPTAAWSYNAITFADESILGYRPASLFVTINNTVYAVNREKKKILVWHENSSNVTMTISGNFSLTFSVFVTSNDDVYIHDGEWNNRVQRWTQKTNTFVTVMKTNSSCLGLFVDTNDTLYCSLGYNNQVLKRSLNNPDIASFSVAAGTGSPGSAFDELDSPKGIFVDVNFDLYVADCGNHRVQLFRSGELNGITVAGYGSSNPVNSLSCPTGIVLDAQKNLFITDMGNHRIFQSGLNGLRCLMGCYGVGAQSYRLERPVSSSFDRFGNIFVMDLGNNRIQKYEYLDKSCIFNSLAPQNIYSSSLTEDSQIYSRDCDKQYYYYESIQVKVIQSGYYSFRSYSTIDAYGLIYRNTFNPLNPSENSLQADDDSDSSFQFRMNIRLTGSMTYVLIMTTYSLKATGRFSVSVQGDHKVILERLSTPVDIQLKYSSKLTADSPIYYRDCQVPKCYFETVEIYVETNGLYVLWSESNINTYGYIYKNDFDSLKPFENLLLQHDGSCNDGQFKLFVHLEINTRYVLVVTARSPNTIGNFSIFISGPNNVTLTHIIPTHHSCVIGDRCNFYIKSIGLTLDDILHDELRLNTTLNNQSFSIKISAALTILMFVAGLINSILSFITFQSKKSRQVGCGLYLLASSVSSLMTISMFTIKFWFVVLSQINISTSLSVLQGGCISLEVILKFSLYLDAWFNACVAVERAFHVFKGVNVDKKKSIHLARQIILILPFCIIATLMHELINRRLFVYETRTEKTSEETTERYVSCVAHYSPAVQKYNTSILFFHLVVPFLANLFSALFIIFGAARQRSVARTDQTFGEHVRKQFTEHKQLIISPVILLVLSIPRLIISLLPGCVKTSDNLWLYLSAYFISFIPSMLIFLIFVAPSDLYMTAFKQSLNRARRCIHSC